MKEIGDYLKETRVENSVSIEEAADDLNLSVNQLENIEEGNVRAFKDMFQLKEMIKDYSKYLGVELDQVMDEFNDFMFEHTSKISLEDIKEARKFNQEQEKEDRIASPYTIIPEKRNIPYKLIGIVLSSFIAFLLLIYIVIVACSEKKEDVTSELCGKGDLIYYEYSN